MKKYNITTASTYSKNGEEKKTYPQVGKLVQFDATNDKPESFILELNMFPNTKFCVFPDKPKEVTETRTEKVETIQYPEEEVNPEDVPF